MGLYLTAFLSGAAIMVLEIVGFRLLPPYFGYSTAVWGSLLGVIMVALSAGYYAGGSLADRRPAPRVLYLVIGVAAGYNLLVLVGYPTLMRLSARLDVVAGSLVATVLLLGVPMFALGAVSPFVIRLLAGEGRVGTVAGRVYGVSTVGGIVGTFGTSFYLIPEFGIRVSLATAFAVLLLAATLGLLARRPRALGST